jgi:hypothetical protein
LQVELVSELLLQTQPAESKRTAQTAQTARLMAWTSPTVKGNGRGL